MLDLQESPESSGGVKFWECDVSKDKRVEECIKEAIEWSEKEAKPVGGAICCAGIAMVGRVSALQSSRLKLDNRAKWETLLNGDFPKGV